eukprot:CAMPEP_0206430692 /NCGR_PEP_ID=MMETSP0324_2-20121206/6955_1 /ASSEMBLY_ACC=CAM_ASM_000836 /TAXON_ID=2866 /ORGANISM="Crypthecodinium cohnii, Strain Seligo" /LENGTH=44 /DNA_ID= /DNA_START= /DNA_END= /DNA_ORIENTATION=
MPSAGRFGKKSSEKNSRVTSGNGVQQPSCSFNRSSSSSATLSTQ